MEVAAMFQHDEGDKTLIVLLFSGALLSWNTPGGGCSFVDLIASLSVGISTSGPEYYVVNIRLPYFTTCYRRVGTMGTDDIN